MALGGVSLAKAKADHDESMDERRQLHELTAEEKQQLRTLAPVREQYDDDGLVLFVGKDVMPAVGMRVRMREGLISHGMGTVTRVLGQAEGDDPEETGTCEVVWDSDQAHTRGLHIKLGNMHVCRTGKDGHLDLILGEKSYCDNLEITSHTLVVHGRCTEHHQVVTSCAHPAPVPGLAELVGADEEASAGVSSCDGGEPDPAYNPREPEVDQGQERGDGLKEGG